MRPNPTRRRHWLEVAPCASASGTPGTGPFGRALLVAKSAVAAERQVSLGVSPHTNLDPLEPQCSFDVATVLGNLVQNGIDCVEPEDRRPSYVGSGADPPVRQHRRADCQ
jgi:hypothetical protein